MVRVLRFFKDVLDFWTKFCSEYGMCCTCRHRWYGPTSNFAVSTVCVVHVVFNVQDSQVNFYSEYFTCCTYRRRRYGCMGNFAVSNVVFDVLDAHVKLYSKYFTCYPVYVSRNIFIRHFTGAWVICQDYHTLCTSSERCYRLRSELF